jgi:glycerophosphoryl diester phosphodiesterase
MKGVAKMDWGKMARKAVSGLSIVILVGLMILMVGMVGTSWAIDEDFLVIAHRGASGYRPEHTLAAYQWAIDKGADFIEPDLVSTKDGYLICRHEMNIEGTTDVEEKFPDRYREIESNGVYVKRWYAYDFTLAEIKTLRARERLDNRTHAYDGLYEIPTLQEVCDLVKEVKEKTGRTVGLYPETKSPTAHKEMGLDFEDKLLEILSSYGYTDASAPIFIQSFERDNLKYLATRTKIRLIQLMSSYEDMAVESLKEFGTYAYGVGPYTLMVLPVNERGDTLLAPTSLVQDAHDLGLKVHVWTLRVDGANNEYRNVTAFKEDVKKMYRAFIDTGIDGYFTDFPDLGAEVKAEYAVEKSNGGSSGCSVSSLGMLLFVTLFFGLRFIGRVADAFAVVEEHLFQKIQPMGEGANDAIPWSVIERGGF